jgi:selenide,water dikinase
MLLFDPQTSGGLLLAVPKRKKAAFLERARQLDQQVWLIGEVVKDTGIEIV